MTEINDLSIKAATVEIKVVKVAGHKMTLSTFRQIQKIDYFPFYINEKLELTITPGTKLLGYVFDQELMWVMGFSEDGLFKKVIVDYKPINLTDNHYKYPASKVKNFFKKMYGLINDYEQAFKLDCHNEYEEDFYHYSEKIPYYDEERKLVKSDYYVSFNNKELYKTSEIRLIVKKQLDQLFIAT